MSLLNLLSDGNEFIRCMTGLDIALYEKSKCKNIMKQYGIDCLRLAHTFNPVTWKHCCKNCMRIKEGNKK